MSYCTVDDLRAEGISEEDYSDEQLENLIAASCEFIDRVTGQWFELRGKSIRLDGRGGQNLVLPVFLFEAYSVSVNHEDIDDYVLYNRMEDRGYPKIFRRAGWPRGRMNINVSGLWGYVEEDGFTPPKRLRGLLVSETTDGHSYALSNEAVSNLSSEAITGDAEIDRILKSYMRSRFRMAVV